jgi:hypothetical protein
MTLLLSIKSLFDTTLRFVKIMCMNFSFLFFISLHLQAEHLLDTLV